MTMARRRATWPRLDPILFSIGFLVVSNAPASAALPSPNGYVNDFANVIDDRRESAIDAVVRDVARTTSAEIAVVTVPSLEGKSVEQYAVELFNAWGIGKKGTNNGVLVLVAPSARTMRIEVGYGLEPVLPDGLTGEIIRSSFVPRFRDGDYSAGILDGVARVAAIVREGKRASDAVETTSAGDDDLPPWLFVPFLGLFVVGGSFGIGVGARARTYVLLIVGIIFAAFPLVVLLFTFPTISLLTVAPIAAAMATIGYSKAGSRKWQQGLRGKTSVDNHDWISGREGNLSSSSHASNDSSSSSDFGGGSSGGGGASGQW